MTSVDAPVLSEEDLRTEAWNGFTDGNWKKKTLTYATLY